MRPEEVHRFWFDETSPEERWKKDPEFDRRIRERFLLIYEAGKQGELFPWRKTPRGRLSEIIVLDQFPRNMFRGSPRAFEADKLALLLSQELVGSGLDRDLSPEEKAFAYMPHMHSESLLIHTEAMRLFSQEGLEDNLRFEVEHRNILLRFGRYPHRNQILGRESTTEEIEFLKTHGGF